MFDDVVAGRGVAFAASLKSNNMTNIVHRYWQ